MSQRLRPVRRSDDVPERWRDGPIGRLLACHNLGAPLEPAERPELLVAMCMDFRKSLRMPEGFAFVLRTGGGNVRHQDFQVAFAVAVGGVSAVALVGHTQCGMVNLAARREAFVGGLVERVGWSRERAERHFDRLAPLFELGDEVDFVLAETARLRRRFPGIPVCPLLYRVEDGRLYLVEEADVSPRGPSS